MNLVDLEELIEEPIDEETLEKELEEIRKNMRQSNPHPHRQDPIDEILAKETQNQNQEILSLPKPANIETMTETEYQNRINEIRQWVANLTIEYNLGSELIPECWDQHISIVTLLSALYGSYLGAFHPAQQAEAAIGYIRNLITIRSELERIMAGKSCAYGQHEPWPTNTWSIKQIKNQENQWWENHQ